MHNDSYVLITAARNEESFIEKTIRSVISQTVLPNKWVIVSDGSTDRTDQIVLEYSNKYEYIHFVRRENKGKSQGFASKVYATREAYSHVNNVDYDFIGNLDADVTFDIHYIENIISKFHENERLGIAGGFVYEQDGGQFRSRPSNTSRSVAGAVQMFRRKCFQGIGGFTPVKHGGEDWIAEIMARMQGWVVESFPEYKVFHQKSSTSARGMLQERMRQGAGDYSLGSHPLFELFKCVRRIKEKPYLVGAFLRMSSYIWSWCRRDDRLVSNEIISYLRKEQIARLKAYFRIGTQQMS